MYEIIRTRLAALKRDDRGVTSVEYAVIAAVLATALFTAFTAFGGSISSALNAIAF
jgi:pilus assembly protein Flp/PilA